MTPSRNPSIPAGYTAGTLTLPLGVVANLLTLIQQQLDPNCSGAAAEVHLLANETNTVQVFVGAASLLGGPLSATNFGYELKPGLTRIYRSAYPGASSPIGNLQVLCLAAGELHVEVCP